ncbi:MAG: ribonuclease P protein component [Alphaproteobacteria bacterium]|jgi:ribonuclease P protein component|nr:ribonuclease P protein component [Alphaproteobacteria bacterium]MDP6564605.1 ribonuclease P protein component [Alphaproteobacteria bacterium]MDP6814538.1 ribonuclease P protein component [Alphaproteobacteria bacterium]
MPTLVDGLGRLKRRSDFLRIARKGRRFAAPGLVLQVARRPGAGGETSETAVRIGFTVSKKVGNAVARNRAKRRLRAAAARVMPYDAKAGRDYVLIGRRDTLRRPYPELLSDLREALRRTGSLAASNGDGEVARP